MLSSQSQDNKKKKANSKIVDINAQHDKKKRMPTRASKVESVTHPSQGDAALSDVSSQHVIKQDMSPGNYPLDMSVLKQMIVELLPTITYQMGENDPTLKEDASNHGLIEPNGEIHQQPDPAAQIQGLASLESEVSAPTSSIDASSGQMVKPLLSEMLKSLCIFLKTSENSQDDLKSTLQRLDKIVIQASQLEQENVKVKREYEKIEKENVEMKKILQRANAVHQEMDTLQQAQLVPHKKLIPRKKTKTYAQIAINAIQKIKKYEEKELSTDEEKIRVEEKTKEIKDFFRPSSAPKFKNKTWIAQESFEKTHDIKMVYVSGFPLGKRIKEIQKFMFDARFRMSEIYHIQFISARICEFMVKENYYSLFCKQLEEYNFQEIRQYDVTMPITQGTRSNEDFAKLKENIKDSFITRLKKNIRIQEERLKDEKLNTKTKEKVSTIKSAFETWLAEKDGNFDQPLANMQNFEESQSSVNVLENTNENDQDE